MPIEETLQKMFTFFAGDAPTLLKLDDDCLWEVLNRLSIGDQIAFSQTCVRFEQLFKTYASYKYKNFDLDTLNDLGFPEVRYFFVLTGATIETVRGSKPNSDVHVLPLITQNCQALRKMDISQYAWKITPNLKGMNKLTELRLNFCKLNDDHVKEISKISNLQELTIEYSVYITGRYLSDINSLQSLSLTGCANIMSSYLNQLFLKHSELIELDIRMCYNLDSSTYDEMVKHCKNLQVLKITKAVASLEKIALLPSLTSLYINHELFANYSLGNLLEALAEHKANTLECLAITSYRLITPHEMTQIGQLRALTNLILKSKNDYGNDSLERLQGLQNLEVLCFESANATDDGLIRMLRAYPKLNYLDLRSCYRLTPNFFIEAIDVVAAREERCKERLAIFAPKMDNLMEILKNPKLIAAAHLLYVVPPPPKLLFLPKPLPRLVDNQNDETVRSYSWVFWVGFAGNTLGFLIKKMFY